MHFILIFLLSIFPVTEWEGETLEIARISRLDMGAYLCIASNGVPPSVSKRIKVSVDCEYGALNTDADLSIQRTTRRRTTVCFEIIIITISVSAAFFSLPLSLS